MNKRYMDFVPAKKAQVRPVRRAPSPNTEVHHEKYVAKIDAGDEILDIEADTFSIKNEARLGVVEDIDPRFVKTDVPKRPLSKGAAPIHDEIKSVKAQKKVGKDAVSEPKTAKKKPAENTYQPPKSPFINQASVVKRPLSKHVYTKKIEPAKEEKHGPVKIIEKPKKDSKIGLVITIILTIILGAAAGTVAFLLLPK